VSLGTALGLGVSVLALLSTVIVGWLRLKHERGLADRADARSILAEGALELGRTKGALKEALTKFQFSLEIGAPWPHNFDELLGNLERQIDSLESAVAAVRIRLKSGDDAVTEIETAVETMRSITDLCAMARVESDFGNESTPDQRWENGIRLKALIDTFDSHRDAYLVAAQRVVGVKLA
jgi:hypothetical protein